MTLELELNRRHQLQNQFEGRDDISPQELRDAGIYGGGRGIWRNKSKTGNLTSDGSGVVVSVLHLGQRYANDLHHDGIVYHFPNNSTAGYDLGDIKSIQNCFTLGISLFVISHGKTKSLRKLHFGKIVDFGDDQCLILFGTNQNQSPPIVPLEQFKLNASTREKRRSVEQRQRDPMFRYWVGKRCGMKCGFCEVEIPELLEAAHIKGVQYGGSDHPLNGLILCANHHKAFDSWLVSVDPETDQIITAPNFNHHELGITKNVLSSRIKPALEALQWQHAKWRKRHPV